jgi:hypothetical protein
MDTSSLGSTGSMASYVDKQTLGAEVVSQTLDRLNSSGTSSYAPTDKQTFGAAVVSKTLDYMNAGSGHSTSNEMSQTYNFSKDVLGAYTSGIGSLTDYNV